MSDQKPDKPAKPGSDSSGAAPQAPTPPAGASSPVTVPPAVLRHGYVARPHKPRRVPKGLPATDDRSLAPPQPEPHPAIVAAQVQARAMLTADAVTPAPVLAFFYPWYAPTAWHKPPMSDLPPVPYLSDDPAVMNRQFQQAQLAKLDGFISSWDGVDTDTDRNFGRLLDLCPAGFAVCPYVETALIKQRGRDLAHELTVLRDRYMGHPRFFRFRSRPALFVWAPKAIGAPAGQTSVDAWRTVRKAVDPGGTQHWNVESQDPIPWFEVFDGFHLFSAADWAAPSANDFAPLLRTNVAYRQRVDGYNRRHHTAKSFAAGVRPGYNDVAIRDLQRRLDPTVPAGYIRDRANGLYYQMCARAAGQSQPDMLVIVSFNEWFEGSQIEPSVTYQEQYLTLSGPLIDTYRAGLGNPLPTITWPPGVRYFPETGCTIQRGFREYWSQKGMDKKLGPPVTDEMEQVINGVRYVVQYFPTGYRLQWNPAGGPLQLVTLSDQDWDREPL